MKHLYYNSMELPNKIRIKSSCFKVDEEYHPWQAGNKPIDMDELFVMSKLSAFDDVQVYLTAHEQAYVKSSKKAIEGIAVTGWISLREYKNGGGYFDDKYCIIIKKPEDFN